MLPQGILKHFVTTFCSYYHFFPPYRSFTWFFQTFDSESAVFHFFIGSQRTISLIKKILKDEENLQNIRGFYQNNFLHPVDLLV